MAEPVDDLPAEDAKLVTLARSARVRARAPEGAAVRDGMGRTYAAASVSLPSMRLTALQAVVAAAVSSGSDRLEAAVIAGPVGSLSAADAGLLDDVGAQRVLLAGDDGSVTRSR